jgi:hypothetical protein
MRLMASLWLASLGLEIVVTGFAKLDRNRQPVPEEAAA